ncbi:MAG TPA: hypothetical protein VMX17_08415 [Candidatus Glassbacteria bacterium]|nr:hypothetical protein [Candidatus Glassbacteria bacterium]
MNEDDAKDEQQERIDFLLKEYDDHRDAIKDMIVDLEKIRVRIDTLIPDNLDARYMRFFEEKVKSITGLFNSLLEMRKEIAKSVKDEIEIRRRIRNDEDLIDIEDLLDVRSMATKIDQFKEETGKIQKRRLKLIKDKIVDSGIEIPGLTDAAGRKLEK